MNNPSHPSCRFPRLVVTLAASLLALSVQAASVTQDIQASVQTLVRKWNAGDAKGAAAVFGDEAMVVGEGGATSVQGREALDKKIAELVAYSGKVQIDIKRVTETGPWSGHAWVLWHITPNDAAEKPFTVRSLFVFTRGRDGFRLRADSYSVGQY